jgi:hypothetical protein
MFEDALSPAETGRPGAANDTTQGSCMTSRGCYFGTDTQWTAAVV